MIKDEGSVVVGYQLRADPRALPPWDRSRRAQYLLKEDVAIPLSVDEVIWPLEDDLKARKMIFADPDEPTNGLNLHRLKDGKVPTVDRGILISIATGAEAFRTLAEKHALEAGVSPAAGLKFLGFDIADAFFISGLSNCGYDADSKGALQREFSAQLNEWGLFVRRQDAERFATDANARVAEHAPFSPSQRTMANTPIRLSKDALSAS